jgi:hypothetical protein
VKPSNIAPKFAHASPPGNQAATRGPRVEQFPTTAFL